MLAHNKVIASLLVLSAFVASLLIGPNFDEMWMRCIIGGAAFFVVSCFLPETRRTTFLSRRSSLGLVGLFTWMAGGSLIYLHPLEPSTIDKSILHTMIEVAGPILLGVVAYLLSIFLIRGFRAMPEYHLEQEGEQVAPCNPYQPPCFNDLP